MIKITGNESAMPISGFVYSDGSYEPSTSGLTIRQHFSAMAMQGLISSGVDYDKKEDVTKIAVTMADALIEELNKNTK